MSENLTAVTPLVAQDAVAPTPKRGFARRFFRNPSAVIALSFLGLVLAGGAFAPWITPHDPLTTQVTNALALPFSADHLLGTDGVGRDVLAVMLYGARTSLLSGLVVVSVSVLIGVPVGLLAGYYRGWIDGVATWVSGALLSLPAIVVLLVVLARVGRSTPLALGVFGVLIAPSVFLLIRTSVRSVREELYVDAARVSGLPDSRIIRRHVLPVVIAPTVIQAALLASAGIGIEAGIAFLGLASATRASWGSMLSDASQNIYNAPWLLIWPSLALVLTVMAFALLGTALRDALMDFGSLPQGRKRVSGKKWEGIDADPVVVAEEGTVVPDDTAGALLSVADLRVAYPNAHGGETDVVRGVTLHVHRGEVLGLVGESGSGKTQTAFSVLGLLPPSARTSATRLDFEGMDLRGRDEESRNKLRGAKIGYIPQEPMSNLDPAFRIGYQLVEPMRVHLRLSGREAKKRALELLGRVGITDPERVFRAYPHEISGGMAQRVLIAGAVSCDPDLLIADEPTTALDVTVQADVLDLIRGLQAERHMAVLLVTHNFGVVADLCDRVAVMRNGEIVETGPSAQIFAEPKHEYTRLLLDSMLEDAPARGPLVEIEPDPSAGVES